jgi:hypothetical protein
MEMIPLNIGHINKSLRVSCINKFAGFMIETACGYGSPDDTAPSADFLSVLEPTPPFFPKPLRPVHGP